MIIHLIIGKDLIILYIGTAFVNTYEKYTKSLFLQKGVNDTLFLSERR